MEKDGMRKLKKCPFCGGNNVRLRSITPISPLVSSRYEVNCYDCHIGTPVLTSKEKAIEVWNTRKPMGRIVERLKERYKNHSTSIEGFIACGALDAASKESLMRTECEIAIEILEDELNQTDI